MNDILSALNLLNGLLSAALNLSDEAAKVSAIIQARTTEGRNAWTAEEKAALDAALETAVKNAYAAVDKLQ